MVKLQLALSKRQKIIFASVVVTLGLLLMLMVNIFLRTRFIFILPVITFLVCLWALWDGINKLKAFTILILPSLFSLGSATFLFLLTWNIYIKIPAAVLIGVLFYCLLLSQNVFNVAAIRTIPLYRAASTASLIFTIITSIFLFHALHVLSLPFAWNGVVVFLISFLLILPTLWSLKMEKVTLEYLIYSLILSLLMAEFAVGLSFWPIQPSSLLWSVPLGTVLFILLGIGVDSFKERLTKKEVTLYGLLGVLIILVLFFTTGWVG